MLIYIVSCCDDQIPDSDRIISFDPYQSDALDKAKLHCMQNNVETKVQRVQIVCRNKEDICRILTGRAQFKDWNTIFTCNMKDGSISVKRYSLG